MVGCIGLLLGCLWFPLTGHLDHFAVWGIVRSIRRTPTLSRTVQRTNTAQTVRMREHQGHSGAWYIGKVFPFGLEPNLRLNIPQVKLIGGGHRKHSYFDYTRIGDKQSWKTGWLKCVIKNYLPPIKGRKVEVTGRRRSQVSSTLRVWPNESRLFCQTIYLKRLFNQLWQRLSIRKHLTKSFKFCFLQ